ncbi:MAG: 6-phosphogluconolactonase, partial [Gammaproteobacteria bacterium]
PLREEVDWHRVHLFFGDERSVPHDHPDSNYRMARETLLERVPVAAEHVHPITARVARIRQDAWDYGRLLCRELPLTPSGVPRFHVILLGLGPDGHVASLFPGTCIQHETRLPTGAVYVPRLKTWRISLTYPVLNQADHILLLAEGEGKADIVARARQRAATSDLLPIQRIEPVGTMEWFLDRAAAARLPTGNAPA